MPNITRKQFLGLGAALAGATGFASTDLETFASNQPAPGAGPGASADLIVVNARVFTVIDQSRLVARGVLPYFALGIGRDLGTHWHASAEILHVPLDVRRGEENVENDALTSLRLQLRWSSRGHSHRSAWPLLSPRMIGRRASRKNRRPAREASRAKRAPLCGPPMPGHVARSAAPATPPCRRDPRRKCPPLDSAAAAAAARARPRA